MENLNQTALTDTTSLIPDSDKIRQELTGYAGRLKHKELTSATGDITLRSMAAC
jgi:hypothetical protein